MKTKPIQNLIVAALVALYTCLVSASAQAQVSQKENAKKPDEPTNLKLQAEP